MSNIIGFSKGLYSSWFYHAPTRSLFDCGEGCASFLGNKVNAVQNIFLSHDHNDHVAGLLTFIAARESGMIAMVKGDDGEEVGKPLHIYYPNTPASFIPLLREYIEKTFPKPSFELRWYGIGEDARLPNGIQSFRTQHYYKMSLGYRVVETRKRLKPAYQGQDIRALLQDKLVDRASLMMDYAANTFVYTLDSNQHIDTRNIFGAETWIADTTFLDPRDRTGRETHATLHEILRIAERNEIKNLICAHFSPRYSGQAIQQTINDYIKSEGPEFNIDWVSPSKIFNF